MQLHLYARPVVTGDFYKTSINQIAKKKTRLFDHGCYGDAAVIAGRFECGLPV